MILPLEPRFAPGDRVVTIHAVWMRDAYGIPDPTIIERTVLASEASQAMAELAKNPHATVWADAVRTIRGWNNG